MASTRTSRKRPCTCAGGALDMDKLLNAFVHFYRWHSESWLERFQYKEAGHQLLLHGLLQRISTAAAESSGRWRSATAARIWRCSGKIRSFPLSSRCIITPGPEPDSLQQLARAIWTNSAKSKAT
ncbi:MAG: hypothetical protein IPK21_15405 [Haliscomenobacter sp.]|nr:hypothetical protein [Haliscomenobacter sp.]